MLSCYPLWCCGCMFANLSPAHLLSITMCVHRNSGTSPEQLFPTGRVKRRARRCRGRGRTVQSNLQSLRHSCQSTQPSHRGDRWSRRIRSKVSQLKIWEDTQLTFYLLPQLCWFQTSLPLAALPLCRVIIACCFRVAALSGNAALALSPSGIAPELHRIQLSAICRGGQSGKVID